MPAQVPEADFVMRSSSRASEPDAQITGCRTNDCEEPAGSELMGTCSFKDRVIRLLSIVYMCVLAPPYRRGIL